jgi:hypothetical protein
VTPRIPKPRITILGAGPIGLETALYARTLGFPVAVLERGPGVGDNVRRWGHVRMFSPWNLNVSPLARRRLSADGHPVPNDPQLCPTGHELVTRYLEPLARLPELAGVIHCGVEVLGCTRRGVGKHYLGSTPPRAAFPFRILARDAEGVEAEHDADIVIDATGVYGNPRALGEGGLPALGEGAHPEGIDREPLDILGAHKRTFAGRRVLLIGGGFSAATSLAALLRLREEAPDTEILWVCRSNDPAPLRELPDDPLPDRARLARLANEVARTPAAGLRFAADRTVRAIRRRDDLFEVDLVSPEGVTESVVCDRIIANVGYRPDASIYRELQVHECYATQGPMNLAASLLAQDTADCLAIQSGGADLLKNPEPDFYILGAKSFGTNSAFLLKLGHEQIAQVFTLITGDPALDLYAS